MQEIISEVVFPLTLLLVFMYAFVKYVHFLQNHMANIIHMIQTNREN